MYRLVLLIVLVSCDNEPPCNCVRAVEVRPFHATRAFVDILCENGTIKEENLHWSNTVVCKENSVRAGDYISGYGSKPYGKIP